MKLLSFEDKCRVVGGWLLVKLGKLTHEVFTQTELNDLLCAHFPIELDVSVPIGKAFLLCQQGEIILPQNNNVIQLNLYNEFHVSVAGNPIYRAHIVAVINAVPRYERQNATLQVEKIGLHSLSLVNDEYSLVKDATTILSLISPFSLASAIANPIKSIVNTVTGGLSDSALDYLQGFTHGNKQKILQQHKPAIEQALLNEVTTAGNHFTMREDHWREYLFAKLGQRVTVDNHQLKFWF